MPNTNAAATAPPPNARKTVLTPERLGTIVVASATVTAAPALTPMISGAPSGFPVIDCITTPAAASVAPTSPASSARGSRIRCTTSWWTFPSAGSKMPTTMSRSPIGSEPIETLQTRPAKSSALIATNVMSARRRRFGAALRAAPEPGAVVAVTSLLDGDLRQLDRDVLVVEQVRRLLSDQLAGEQPTRLRPQVGVDEVHLPVLDRVQLAPQRALAEVLIRRRRRRVLR